MLIPCDEVNILNTFRVMIILRLLLLLTNLHLKLLHRRLTKFLYSMIHSDNDTVKVMTAFFLSTEASFLAENFRFIMYTYKIPMFAWYKELSVLLKCITCPR